jgi:hypothetical protein
MSTRRPSEQRHTDARTAAGERYDAAVRAVWAEIPADLGTRQAWAQARPGMVAAQQQLDADLAAIRSNTEMETDMGIFKRDHTARDAAVETARAWREYQEEQEHAARQPAPQPQVRSGVLHRGPGVLDISGQVLGTGNTVTTPEGTITTPEAPARERQAGHGGGGHAWHNDGVINRGDGQVVISGDTVMGCGQTSTHQADREAG